MKIILSKLKVLLSKKFIKYAVISVIVAVVGVGGYFTYKKVAVSANAKNATSVRTVKVVRGDLNLTITGTGTVEPSSSYNIVPLVNGTVVSAPFEEGMSVKAGDLLYRIDDSDLSYSIQKSEDNISKLQMNHNQSASNLSNYTVAAPAEGRLSDFTLNVGDQVSNGGKIGTIENEKFVKATLQFSKYQVQKMKVGDKAQLVLPDYMYYIEGTVTHISNASKADSDGAVVCDVEITADNPGAISSGITVTGIVETSSGSIQSPGSSTTSYATSQSVITKASSSVKEIYVKNNEWVKAGQKILTLDDANINNSIQQSTLDIKDAQISLNSQRKQLDNYNITSPINGTVITKNYKAGDTIGMSSDSKVLMVVADISKMKFTISVDELDIAKVSKGQKVNVTADALTGNTFEGEVTKVPLIGTTTNGVTTYDVEVTIPSPGALKPGMNVNAEIEVQSKKDILYVPTAAVTKVGGKAYVYVPSASTTGSSPKNQNSAAEAASEQQNDQQSTQRKVQRNESDGSQTASQSSASNSYSGGSSRPSANIAGRQRKEVEIGINNDDYIEIVSGLNEGDTVYIPTTSTSTANGTVAGNRNMIGGGGMGFAGGMGGGQRRGD